MDVLLSRYGCGLINQYNIGTSQPTSFDMMYSSSFIWCFFFSNICKHMKEGVSVIDVFNRAVVPIWFGCDAVEWCGVCDLYLSIFFASDRYVNNTDDERTPVVLPHCCEVYKPHTYLNLALIPNWHNEMWNDALSHRNRCLRIKCLWKWCGECVVECCPITVCDWRWYTINDNFFQRMCVTINDTVYETHYWTRV